MISDGDAITIVYDPLPAVGQINKFLADARGRWLS